MPKLIASTWEDSTPVTHIRNPIDFDGSDDDKVKALGVLSDTNQPILNKVTRAIDKKLGSKTSVNRKLPDRIVEKANRPATAKKDPWFGIEHVRDSLRFRTSIKLFEDVEEIYKILVARGDIEFVKVDLAKMFQPKAWGWRFAAVDLAMPNKQIVEYYQSFKEMIDVNDDIGHELFEKWRNASEEETMREAVQFRKDLEASSEAYTDVWNKKLRELKLNEISAKVLWQEIRGRIGY